jgi:methylphosphotriester-DNA--protein-cysteine methyltransferase
MLSNTIYQQARLSRDPRFDGSFFTAVKTTRIYCRSIFPAIAPKESNVVYYHSIIETGVRAILGQQILVAAAQKLVSALLCNLGEKIGPKKLLPRSSSFCR